MATMSAGIDADTKDANAEFIVRACNSHQALVDALRELLALVEGECPSLLEDNHHHEMVVAALALAEGR